MPRFSLPALLAVLLALPVVAPASAQSAESVVVREAIAEYQRTGRARVLEVGQTILVPYGQVDPVLKTALLRTTLIELGRNEWVVDRFMGDTLRWDVDFGVVGTDDSFRQVVSIRPTDQDLTTSLVLTTSAGRIYQLTLDSEPYPQIERTQNPTDIPYTAHVKFYYPDEGSADGLVTLTSAAFPDAPAFVDPNGLALRTADYVIEADDAFPCPPVSAGDNGTHLRLHFPNHTDDLACAERFPLYAVAPDGALELINYSVEGGNTYVADRVPAEARLLYRTQSGAVHQVHVRNKSMNRGRRPAGLEIGAALGAALPAGSDPFQQTYAPGLDLALSGGLQTTRALTLGLEAGYRSLSADAALLDGAVEYALNQAYAASVASDLRAAGALSDGESVALFSRGAQSTARTLRLSAFGRLALAPGARVEPYVGGRIGVARHSASAATFQASGLVIGADGVQRQSAELDAALARRFGADTASPAEAAAFQARLRGEYGSAYELPTWVGGGAGSGLALDVGATFGLAVRATSSVRVFAEGAYTYSTLGALPSRSLVPLHLGVRASL